MEGLIELIPGHRQLKFVEPIFGCVVKLDAILIQMGQTRHVFTNAGDGPFELPVMVGESTDQPDVSPDIKSIHPAQPPLVLKVGKIANLKGEHQNAFQLAPKWQFLTEFAGFRGDFLFSLAATTSPT